MSALTENLTPLTVIFSTSKAYDIKFKSNLVAMLRMPSDRSGQLALKNHITEKYTRQTERLLGILSALKKKHNPVRWTVIYANVARSFI